MLELLLGHRFTVASYGPAAGYAAWLLRQYGAEVEHTTALDPEGLGAFLGEGAHYDPVPRLTGSPGEVFITDATVTPDSRAALEALAREAHIIWLTPWGLDNPLEHAPATDLLLMAAGGWMSAVGDPDRAPLGPPGAQAQFVAGLYAAIHALAAPHVAGLSVISMVEAVAATCIYDSVTFQYLGAVRQRIGHRFGRAQCTIVTLPTADGHIGVHAALHHHWLQLCEFMGRPDLITDPRFEGLLERVRHLPELDEILHAWAAPQERFSLYRGLQGARIPASPIPSLAEVLDSPQLAAREAWHSVITPAGRRLRVPGAPVKVIGEAGPAAALETTGPWEPGRLRVVDLSMGWAGPYVSHILSCYGAEVIKIESHKRFDWWRGSRPPGEGPADPVHERSAVFNTVNRGKRGLTLDLATTEGNALARDLLRTADVVIENFTAGVLEKLGLSYETLAAENPRLIMLRQPGFGSTGPEASYVSFGCTIEAMAGLTSILGYPDGRLFSMSNALGDPVSGLGGTIAVLAAVAARERDGRGRCIEAAQYEGFLPLMSAELIDFQRTGVLPLPAGNRRKGAWPSGVYPASGENEWIAIEVTSDEAWASLARLLGGTALDARWRASEARASGADEVDSLVEAWTRARNREDALAHLAEAGVPAAPVNCEADILAGEPFLTTGFFEPFEREHVGTHLYPSLPVHRQGVRPQPPGAAPTLGEHNGSILEALGVGPERIGGLRHAGIIGEVPG